MKQLESQLQQACVQWFRFSFPKLSKLLFAVPNGHLRSKATATRLKKEGVVSGVSDLILLVPSKGFNSLCIEMKHGPGKQTDNQRSWQKQAETYGNKYAIVKTFDEFIETVKDYLTV